MAKDKKKPDSRRKKKTEVSSGKVFVNATFNNTMATLTDQAGNVLVWGSSGRAGFKGTRKSTPYAATTAIEQILKKGKEDFGLKSVGVYLRGPGPGRDAALRVIKSSGLHMDLIADVTGIPYNGPRAKKKRRV